MNEIKCVIIEDQRPAQQILIQYIKDLSSLKLEAVFTNVIEAGAFLKENDVDLIFLDIHLPKLSGLEFLEMAPIRPNVIITTAYPDYALQGFELDAIDYLLKPFSFERFERAIGKLRERDVSAIDNGDGINSEETFTFIKDGREVVKVPFEDIVYVKASGDYVELVRTQQKHLIAYTMKFWEELLSGKGFFRVHKSYIINLNRIDKISGNQVHVSGEKIPVGRSYQQAFWNKININN